MRVLLWLQHETRDVPPRPLPWFAVLGRAPLHVPKVADLGPCRQEHQYPLVEWVDQDDALALLLLLDRLADPGGRALLLSLVYDGPERRVDVVGRAPLAGEAVETVRHGMRARVEVKIKGNYPLTTLNSPAILRA